MESETRHRSCLIPRQGGSGVRPLPSSGGAFNLRLPLRVEGLGFRVWVQVPWRPIGVYVLEGFLSRVRKGYRSSFSVVAGSACRQLYGLRVSA